MSALLLVQHYKPTAPPAASFDHEARIIHAIPAYRAAVVQTEHPERWRNVEGWRTRIIHDLVAAENIARTWAFSDLG